jgi:acetolactate synthase I/III small subunit
MKLTIHLCVEDKPGVLMRVAGIITAKGANIDALYVAPDPDQAGIARIILVAQVEPRLQQRIVNEMNRLVQVLVAADVTERKEDVARVLRDWFTIGIETST